MDTHRLDTDDGYRTPDRRARPFWRRAPDVGGRFYQIRRGQPRRRALKEEKLHARAVIVPYLQAEEDRRFVRAWSEKKERERSIMSPRARMERRRRSSRRSQVRCGERPRVRRSPSRDRTNALSSHSNVIALQNPRYKRTERRDDARCGDPGRGRAERPTARGRRLDISFAPRARLRARARLPAARA